MDGTLYCWDIDSYMIFEVVVQFLISYVICIIFHYSPEGKEFTSLKLKVDNAPLKVVWQRVDWCIGIALEESKTS